MDLTVRSEIFALDRRDWLDSEHGTDATIPATLDLAEFAGNYSTNGFIPSGTPLSVKPDGTYAPYGGTTDEQVTLTVGGSGLTSFTLTFGAQTTAAIDDQATGAQVQAALELLSTIGAGNVVVTGPAGGPWVVTFAGDLADTNVGAITTTPTGGTGSVTPSVGTTGGADVDAERATLVGHLYAQVKVNTGSTKASGALLRHGFIKEDKLPFPVDANGKADVAGFIQYRAGV